MTRIIRCPSCAAVYALDAAHIQAAHGWLRCGQCHETFNGTGLDVPAPTALLSHAADRSEVPAEAAPAEAPPTRIALDELLLHEDRSEKSPAPVPEVSADLMDFSEALATFKPVAPYPEAVSAAPPEADQPRSPVLLYSLAMVLGLLLMGQVFFHQRHAMAAMWPSSLPVLENLCRPVGCQIQPWMDPAAVVLEESSFTENGESFLLSWTLRNTGPMTVKTTALEFSLLDQFNNTLVRRVLLEDDTQAPGVMSPGQVWKGSVPVQVDPLLVFSRHRLVSFYP